LIFAGYTGNKNQVLNRQKIQFIELDFSKLIFQKSSTDQQGVSKEKLESYYIVCTFVYSSDVTIQYSLEEASFLLTLQIPLAKNRLHTEPERIYNSHYGNGVPAIFTS
jgi:hypothetical protein